MRRFVCSLPNPGTAGFPRELFSNDEAQIDAFAKAQDGFGKGIYDCIGLFPANASKRNKQTVAALPILIADLDLKNIDHSTEEVLQVLDNMLVPPTEVRDSGNGLHAIWRLKEPLTSDDDMARGERAMKRLAELLAGDSLPTHRAALLRRPGTTNTKGGHSKACHVLAEHSDAARIYDITEIEEMLDLYNRPLLNLKQTEKALTPGGNGASQDKYEGPIDVDARLAAMTYKGPGRSCVHYTQLDVTAALTGRGQPIQETVERVLTATKAAVENDRNPECRNWDWKKERHDIEKQCYDLVNKAMEKTGEDLSHTLPDELADKWQEILAAGGRPMVCPGNGGAYHIRKYDWKENVSNESAPSAAPQPAASPKLKRKLTLDTFVPFDPKDLPPRRWLYGRHYQRGVVSVTAARGGTGKSTKKTAEAIAMAISRNLLGVQPEERCRVWLHNGEDSLVELKRKVAAVCQHYDVPMEDLVGWLYLTSGDEFPLKVARGYQELKIESELVEQITGVIDERAIDVFMADPLITLHGVNESDNGKMDQVMRVFTSIAAGCDCSVDLSHHMRKLGSGINEATADDARGASAIHDAVRYLEVLNVMPSTDALHLGIDDYERLSYFRSDQGKANTAPPPKKANWFKIENIEIANGDQVGVVVPWERPEQESRDAEIAAEAMFLRLLDKLRSQDRYVSPHVSGSYAPKVFSEQPEAKRARIGKRALGAAMERLFASGIIEVEDIGKPSRPVRRIKRASPPIVPKEGDE
jgi:RecA-family ATPase